MEVAIDLVKPSPYQPRITFNVEDLKQEIASGGLLSELIVREKDTHFELVDGERRLKSLKELGWKMVPVQVINVDDREARRRIFRLNRHRRNYSAEEEARFFRKFADEGMASYEIAQDLGIDDNWVRANLNIFKFPQHIQESIWSGTLFPTHIRQLEPIIKADMKRAIELAEQCKEQSLTTDDLAKLLKPEVAAIEEARLKAAEQKLGDASPNVLLETPEQIEAAAEALKREAQKRREEALTAEAREAKEKAKLERKQRLAEEKRQREEAERKRLEEKIRRQIEAEARKRAEEELLTSPDFIQKAMDKQVEIAMARGEEELATEGEGEPVVSRDEMAEAMAEAEKSDFTFKLEGDLYNLAKARQLKPIQVVDKLPAERLNSLAYTLPGYIEFLRELLSLIKERLEMTELGGQ